MKYEKRKMKIEKQIKNEIWKRDFKNKKIKMKNEKRKIKNEKWKTRNEK